MLAGSSAYKKRLVRMKTVSNDCRKYRSSVLLSESSRSARKANFGGKKSDKLRNLHLKDRLPAGAIEQAQAAAPAELWMRQPKAAAAAAAARRTELSRSGIQLFNSSNSVEYSTSDSCSSSSKSNERRQHHRAHQHSGGGGTASLLDLQTNNSRREAAARPWGTGEGGSSSVTAAIGASEASQMVECLSEDSEPDIQNSNAEALPDDISNENAVAKGANALVKQATSRQTEIIDTSKLLEEGKVEVQYEEPDDEPEEIEETDYALIDEYEKSFAYARRLRALLNMKFKVVDRSSIETNFLMVKAHEHPTQRVLDRWRNVDLGQAYDSQIRMNRLIDDFKQACGSKKKPKKGEVRVPVFPDWIRFCFRFKKDSSEKRWSEFCAYKQRMKKLSGGQGAVPKANDKYLPAYYDIWSTSVTVFSKPDTTVLNMVEPVFSKLGLDARADFRFTVGAFEGDKRAGKAKIQGAPAVSEEVTMQALCGDLYQRNCLEIFVNDNRIEMYKAFPTFYEPAGGDNKSKGSKGSKGSKDDKKGKDKKGGKNQSNLTSTNAASVTTDDVDSIDNTGNRILTARLSTVRQHLRCGTLGSSGYSEVSGNQQQHPQGGDTANTADAVDNGAVFSDPATTANSTARKKKKTVVCDPREYQDDEEVEPSSFSPPEPELDDEEAPEDFDSSPSATNQNLSIHDCDSSDESQPTLEESTPPMKTGRGETMKE